MKKFGRHLDSGILVKIRTNLSKRLSKYSTQKRILSRHSLSNLNVNSNMAIYLLLFLILTLIIIKSPAFAEPGQLIRFIARVSPLAIAALGQYFVILSGELDLSIGAIVTSEVVIAGTLIGGNEARVIPVLLLMFIFGGLVGLFNGIVVAYFRVPSLIVTLGTMLVLTGSVYAWTGGSVGDNPVDSFRQIGRDGLKNIPIIGILPYSVIIFVLLTSIAVIAVRRPFGKAVVSVGGNRLAANSSGIQVSFVKIKVFVISSLCATITGILVVGYAGVGHSVGAGYEFATVTAVLLGGVALSGGRGWLLSAIAGAFALEALFVLLNFYSVPSTYRDSVQGAIILIAVALTAQEKGTLKIFKLRSKISKQNFN